jgi:hypothetical protein
MAETTSTFQEVYSTVCESIFAENKTYYWMKDIYQSQENEMKVCEFARKHYPRTDDAVLVSKWFGDYLTHPMTLFFIRGKEADLLAEAQRLEAEENAKKKSS